MIPQGLVSRAAVRHKRAPEAIEAIGNGESAYGALTAGAVVASLRQSRVESSTEPVDKPVGEFPGSTPSGVAERLFLRLLKL
jgi:hypothetical protein